MDRIRSLVQQHVNSAVVLQEVKRALPQWPSLSCQSLLSKEALDFDAKYPLSVRYYRHLLKVIIKDIESINSNIDDYDDYGVDDRLAELVVKSQLLADDIDDTCYMRFILPPSAAETIETTDKDVIIKLFRSHNQVGCRLWDAGLFMSAFLINNINFFRDKKIIELGAGVGMSSLTYAARASEQQCNPKSIVITDFHDDVLLLIKSNISLNKHLFPCMDITAAKVDWLDMQALATNILHSPDFIFAADCTYSADLHIGLLDTIESLLCRPGRVKLDKGYLLDDSFDMDSFLIDYFVGSDSGGSLPICFVASCRRTEDTYLAFVDALRAKAASLRSVDITQWALNRCPERLYYYNHIELLRIWLIVPVKE